MIGNPIELIKFLYNQEKDKIFEIKEPSKKRKLTQNSYYWVLLNKLALKLKLSKEEIHLGLLKEYSIRYQIMIPKGKLPRELKYYEKKGEIKNREVYNIFTPSHELDKKEFALLLDGIIQECKQFQIPTLTPEEIAKLKYYER